MLIIINQILKKTRTYARKHAHTHTRNARTHTHHCFLMKKWPLQVNLILTSRNTTLSHNVYDLTRVNIFIPLSLVCRKRRMDGIKHSELENNSLQR